MKTLQSISLFVLALLLVPPVGHAAFSGPANPPAAAVESAESGYEIARRPRPLAWPRRKKEKEPRRIPAVVPFAAGVQLARLLLMTSPKITGA